MKMTPSTIVLAAAVAFGGAFTLSQAAEVAVPAGPTKGPGPVATLPPLTKWKYAKSKSRTEVHVGIGDKRGACGIREWPDQVILNKKKRQAVWRIDRDASEACRGKVVTIGKFPAEFRYMTRDGLTDRIEIDVDPSVPPGLYHYEIHIDGKLAGDPDVDIIDHP